MPTLKERLAAGLERSRAFTEGLLANFKTPEQWTHQAAPRVNHAIWIAGHLSVADNYFVSLVAADKKQDNEQFGGSFGMGSEPAADISQYPPVEEVLAYLRDRRTALLAALEACPEDELDKATEEGAPDFLPDRASVFQFAAWHEGIHAGQLTVAHRALGHDPLFGSPPPAE